MTEMVSDGAATGDSVCGALFLLCFTYFKIVITHYY